MEFGIMGSLAFGVPLHLHSRLCLRHVYSLRLYITQIMHFKHARILYTLKTKGLIQNKTVWPSIAVHDKQSSSVGSHKVWDLKTMTSDPAGLYICIYLNYNNTPTIYSSKILRGQTKIVGRKMVEITQFNCMKALYYNYIFCIHSLYAIYNKAVCAVMN